MKARQFVDTATIHVRAGNGGNGCVSFRREKFVPKGGPDGGDGGRGGHVVLRAGKDVRSLTPLFYAPQQYAAHGVHGKGKKLSGKSGADLVVMVPCGTEVWDREEGRLLCDMAADGDEYRAARGGRGGLGNCHWLSATHQCPKEHTDGEPGEQRTLLLKLKILADIGLVGYPNAGKSSLLAAISHAHPKIAAYPFTTLHPVIGTVAFEDFFSFTVADIPGLIAGAHEGVGLGDSFLRHIERSSALVFVMDMAGVDGRDPADDYASLLNELNLYKEGLEKRPSLVVANKMDLPEAKNRLSEFARKTGTKPLKISALDGQGIPALKKALRRLLERKKRRPTA